MVNKESVQELKARVDGLAATINGLEFKINPNIVPEQSTKGLIWIFTYTVTYQGQTQEMTCDSERLGQQISSLVDQLGLKMTPEQIDMLHKVQTWKP